MKQLRTVSAATALRRTVDQFMAADKTVDGTAQWRRGNGHRDVRALWPIFRDGASTGATLQATAYPDSKTPHFTIGVHWDDCLWRLDYEPMTEKHRNPLPQNTLAARHHIIAGPHVHPWADNRQYAVAGRAFDLPFAVPYTGTAKWASALRWACGEVNIKMIKAQMIDWPQRTTLL
jgi:hypothetical protein